MEKVYCVMVCKKFETVGMVSSECYSSLKEAQDFCKGRTGTYEINEMYYTSDWYEYYIHELKVK